MLVHFGYSSIDKKIYSCPVSTLKRYNKTGVRKKHGLKSLMNKLRPLKKKNAIQTVELLNRFIQQVAFVFQ